MAPGGSSLVPGVVLVVDPACCFLDFLNTEANRFMVVRGNEEGKKEEKGRESGRE
jgi:hypothetical protein